MKSLFISTLLCLLLFAHFVFPNFLGVLKKKTWLTAQQYCNDTYSTNLAMITSKSLQNEINNSILINTINENKHYWIGLSDFDSENNWLWIDGSLFNYSNWRNGEPNNIGEENCVEIQADGKWNDENCNELNYFICDRYSEVIIPTHSPFKTNNPTLYPTKIVVNKENGSIFTKYLLLFIILGSSFIVIVSTIIGIILKRKSKRKPSQNDKIYKENNVVPMENKVKNVLALNNQCKTQNEGKNSEYCNSNEPNKGENAVILYDVYKNNEKTKQIEDMNDSDCDSMYLVMDENITTNNTQNE